MRFRAGIKPEISRVQYDVNTADISQFQPNLQREGYFFCRANKTKGNCPDQPPDDSRSFYGFANLASGRSSSWNESL